MPADVQLEVKLLTHCRQICLKKPRTVLLPDAMDVRTLQAARYLKDNRLAKPVLVGSPVKLREFASENKINTSGIKVRKPEHDPKFDHLVRAFYDKRKAKGLSRLEAQELLKKPLWYAAMALQLGQADLSVSGNQSATAEVLKAGIQVVGLEQGIQTVSSFFVMIAPDDTQTLAFSDCAVVPRPTDAQLADIAISTSRNFEKLSGQEARTALLSFSTAGSAEHALTQTVRDALDMVHQKQPGLLVDGEVQFDAAIVPAIARQKIPASRLQGQANVFIFPSLNAGNIGYKIAERIAGYTAIGPFIQGLAKPFHDLSRGCSTEDIVNTVIVGSCMI